MSTPSYNIHAWQHIVLAGPTTIVQVDQNTIKLKQDMLK